MAFDFLHGYLYHIGLFGAFVYLTAYFLLQAGFIRGSSYTYTLLNLLAATCVVVSLIDAYNAASMIIQVSWICLSLYGLARIYFIKHSIRFSGEDDAFLQDKLAGMPKNLARGLLSNAVWLDGKAGTVLTEEGRLVRNLIYLPDGKANVIVEGRHITQTKPGSFVGEMTCLSGEPATATVVLAQDARYMAISAETIRHRSRRDLDLKNFLELSFARDVHAKLRDNNTGLGDRRKAALSERMADTP